MLEVLLMYPMDNMEVQRTGIEILKEHGEAGMPFQDFMSEYCRRGFENALHMGYNAEVLKTPPSSPSTFYFMRECTTENEKPTGRVFLVAQTELSPSPEED